MSNPPPVIALLLAAGASTRFGADDKLLAEIGGEPLVVRSAARLLASDANEVIAVIAPGAGGAAVASALSHLRIRIVTNSGAATGIGSSIACGAAANGETAAGTMIVPGDMPSLDVPLINALIATFRERGGHKIVHPVTLDGQQRNPVIWPARLHPELMSLDPAQGGKPLLAAHRESTVTLTVALDQSFEDIDTLADLARACAAMQSRD